MTQLAFAVGLGDLSPGLRAFIARLTETFPLVPRRAAGRNHYRGPLPAS